MAKVKRRKRNDSDVKEIAKDIEKTISKPVKKNDLKNRKLLSTGSTMLNLALSDDPYGGIALGTIVHIVGDTHAGKSLLAETIMAEAAYDKDLDKHALVYEEPESAMFFDIEKMFGKKTAERIINHPKIEDRIKPRTVQQWHDDLMKWELPFVWVTDSFDALTSEDDLKVDSPTKGGWHTEKASVASTLFPKIVGRVEASNSLYVWISQTRDNIGVTFGPKKNFTGGNAIKFYRAYEIWLAVDSFIYKTVKGSKEEVGANILVKVKKCKYNGKKKIISFPVYPYPYGYGIDDLTSMIDWLIDKGFWNKPKGKSIIETEDPFIDGKIETIIKHIEQNNLEDDLKKVVGECWLEIEKELSTDRKPKYE